jgi:hypothetical protein
MQGLGMVLDLIGGGLAANDMAQNGVNEENTLDLTSSGLGIAGTLLGGAAGAVLGAAGAGIGIGRTLDTSLGISDEFGRMADPSQAADPQAGRLAGLDAWCNRERPGLPLDPADLRPLGNDLTCGDITDARQAEELLGTYYGKGSGVLSNMIAQAGGEMHEGGRVIRAPSDYADLPGEIDADADALYESTGQHALRSEAYRNCMREEDPARPLEQLNGA